MYNADSGLATACGVTLWSAAFLAYLVRVGAVDHTSLLYRTMGIILAVVQVALPVACFMLLAKGFGLYAWQVRTRQCLLFVPWLVANGA